MRLSEYVSASDKRYQATVRLGTATDTYDAEGRYTRPTSSVDHITEGQLTELLTNYQGEIWQTPPAHSAVKVKGRKAYEQIENQLKNVRNRLVQGKKLK